MQHFKNNISSYLLEPKVLKDEGEFSFAWQNI